MKTIISGPLTFSLSESGGALTIISCDKRATEVILPDYVEGVPVVAIGEGAFADCEMLERVLIPSDEAFLDDVFSTFEIMDQAFSNCTALKEVDIPGRISMLGHGAFRCCTSLERIYLPRCYVAPYAFSNCTSLKEINPLSYISEGMFSHCKSLSAFPVKEGAQAIDADAFEHCYSLVDIVIPASVKRIEPLAFRSCYGLKTVVFEDPTGWYGSNSYTGKHYSLNLDDPKKNAELLSRMDFDDGCGDWYKKDSNFTSNYDDLMARFDEMDKAFFESLRSEKKD